MTNIHPPFWLVWNPAGHVPRFEHSTYEAARAEAERLCLRHPGQVFYVLAPVAKGVKQDVVWEHLIETDEDGIPF